MTLDPDTRMLYQLLEKHGSEWVKKRICPKEAAAHALSVEKERLSGKETEVEGLETRGTPLDSHR